MTETGDSRARIRAGLERVAELLDGVGFTLPTPERARLEEERRRIIAVVRDYLLPRLRDPDAPVVAAVVGASGTGKSTIVNALAQDRISPTGAVRPTTVAPVLWGHRELTDWYTTKLIPRLRTRTGQSIEMTVGNDEMTRNLTVIDTPPLDLPRHGAGPVAADVLSLADMCVFVTTATRYADAAGWEFVADAQARGVPLLFVINRLQLDPDRRREVLGDFAERLSKRGLLIDGDPDAVFGIAESRVVSWHQGLEPVDVAPLRKELSELSDPDFRAALLDQVTITTGQELGSRLRVLTSALREENRRTEVLWDYAAQSYALQEARLRGELSAGMFAPVARLATWSQAAVELTGVVTRRAGVAAQDAAAAWFEDAVGVEILAAGGQGLWRHAHDTTYDTQTALETWGAGLEDLVAAYARRSRLSGRARRRAAAKLWKHALDPNDDGKIRVLGDRFEDCVTAARDGLIEALGLSLRADLQRFSAALGGVPSDEVATELEALEQLVALGPAAPGLPDPEVVRARMRAVPASDVTEPAVVVTPDQSLERPTPPETADAPG